MRLLLEVLGSLVQFLGLGGGGGGGGGINPPAEWSWLGKTSSSVAKEMSLEHKLDLQQ